MVLIRHHILLGSGGRMPVSITDQNQQMQIMFLNQINPP
jgi:hypothetical protein